MELPKILFDHLCDSGKLGSALTEPELLYEAEHCYEVAASRYHPNAKKALGRYISVLRARGIEPQQPELNGEDHGR